jgi:putative oxidoreductase
VVRRRSAGSANSSGSWDALEFTNHPNLNHGVTNELSKPTTELSGLSEFAGRILLASIFLISGLVKIGTYAATAGYMDATGIPGELLPVVIAFEVLAAIALVVGWKTRLTALLLAGFTLVAGLLFHNNFADPMQMIMFLKNIAITGGLLILVANGAGAVSFDRRAAN